jgi:hypothetical protein
VRGFFAPVNRAAQMPVLFDPVQQGRFNMDAPPAPWVSLGWIQDFARNSVSKTMPVMTGIPASPLEQLRETLAATVSLQFLSWTKLTMALATGSQHMNLLTTPSGETDAADGAQAIPAVIPQSGSTASSILLAAADAAKFTVGSIVAVDLDNTGQMGYIGSPVSGAFLRQPVTDVDYVRRVTFNVGLVSAVNATGITLAEPLIGGAPAAGANVQVVSGFVDREGGSFYQEWSALFVMEGSQGERVFFYYPRLQTAAGAEENAVPLAGKQKTGHARIQLKGQFLALPITDPMDGERVVCYRSFLPAANALI